MQTSHRKIEGGYILYPRRFLDMLADAPLLDRVLWTWLYCKANHTDSTGYRRNLRRGQLLTTINEIRQAMQWRCGGAIKRPTRQTVWRTLERYRERDMIETRKTTRGLIITICEYGLYQNPANYGGNAGGDTNETPNVTKARHYKQECNKNEKNGSTAPLCLSSGKSFDQMDRERAEQALEQAARRFLSDEQE